MQETKSEKCGNKFRRQIRSQEIYVTKQSLME